MMDRFFNEPMAGLRGWTEAAGLPPVDLFQTDDEVVVKATLPGVRAEDLNISVTGDVLTLRGSMSDEAATREVTYYMRERRAGEFSRSLPLPAPAIADRARAKFENGVLTLTLPKADEVKPKTTIVKAK